MKFPLSEYLTSFIIRLAQVVLAIINLGLSAKLVNEVSWDRYNYSLAVSVLTLIYLGVLLFPLTLTFIPPLVLVISEGIFWVLWLSQFAAMADAWGSVSCGDLDSFFGVTDTCKISKATIAMGVLQWVLFSLSLALVIVFTIVPLGAFSNAHVSTNNDYISGGIFANTPATVDNNKSQPSDEDIEKHVDSPENTVQGKATESGDLTLEPTVDQESAH